MKGAHPNRENCFQWFFEKTEGLLNEQEKEQLRIFLLLNPDLQEEFDLWNSTRLSPADEKSGSFLLKRFDNGLSEKEFLELFEDNDLEELERLSKENEELSKTLKLYAATRLRSSAALQDWFKQSLKKSDIDEDTLILRPDSHVVFSDKESLKRKEREAPILPLFVRYASAAAALLAIMFYLSGDKGVRVYEARKTDSSLTIGTELITETVPSDIEVLMNEEAEEEKVYTPLNDLQSKDDRQIVKVDIIPTKTDSTIAPLDVKPNYVLEEADTSRKLKVPFEIVEFEVVESPSSSQDSNSLEPADAPVTDEVSDNSAVVDILTYIKEEVNEELIGERNGKIEALDVLQFVADEAPLLAMKSNHREESEVRRVELKIGPLTVSRTKSRK